MGSVNYPFEVFSHHEDFHPFEATKSGPSPVPSAAYDYTKKEITEILDATQNWGKKATSLQVPKSLDGQFYSVLLKECSATIESAKACLAAREEAKSKGQPFSGPSESDLQDILDGGIKGLAQIDGFQFRALCTDLRVFASGKPDVQLKGPTVTLSNLKIVGDACAEVWWYHPSFHCSWLCFNWSVTWSWGPLIRVCVEGVKFDVAAHATAATDGPLVTVTATADRLRLDYDILRELPLENIANHYLADKRVLVYDASKLVAAVPVLGSRFQVSSVDLPAITGGLQVNVSVKQV